MTRKLTRVRRAAIAFAVVTALASLGVAPADRASARPLRRAIVAAQPSPMIAAAQPSPSVFGFGMANAPGSVLQLTAGGVSWNYRYQYLAGGVNTGGGWTTWNADGQFAAFYMKESADNGFTPVFTYYQLLQSKPAAGGREDDADFTNLNNADTMRAYYREFKQLLESARAFGLPVVIHVEPDLAGYMQQRVVVSSNSAASITAAVANTGLPELAGLPNTYQGFNLALLRLRDQIAPNALLATHASAWSTRIDVTKSTDATIDVAAVARRTAEFLATAGMGRSTDGTSTYDYVFTDASDRDAGFHQIVNGDGGASWWDETNTKVPNFNTFNRYLQALTSATGRKAFVWQVPMGNTVMRTENNTWNHYQDNRVQYWLGGYPNDGHLAALARSGVAAILWGRGADGNSSADDNAHDGVTNPPAVNGNDRLSTSADDDGGYLKERMLAYQKAGALRVDGSSPDTPGPIALTPATTKAASTSTSPVPPTTPPSTALPPASAGPAGSSVSASSPTRPAPTASSPNVVTVPTVPTAPTAPSGTVTASGKVPASVSPAPETTTASTTSKSKSNAAAPAAAIGGPTTGVARGNATVFTLDVATTGKHTFNVIASTPDNGAAVRFQLDGVALPGRFLVARQTPKRRTVTLATRSINVQKGRHSLTIVPQSGRVTVSGAKVR